MTLIGRIIMGIGCGVITAVIRLLTENTEGVSYAIMIMNILVPLIDRYTVPRSFGGGKYNA
jgi:electron transport complex protein RnfD